MVINKNCNTQDIYFFLWCPTISSKSARHSFLIRRISSTFSDSGIIAAYPVSPEEKIFLSIIIFQSDSEDETEKE